MAATDDRANLVLAQFLNNTQLHNYALPQMTDVGEALSFGESIKIPSVQTTVLADGSQRVDLSALAAPSKSKVDLIVDKQPWVPHLVPRLDQMTGLRGGFLQAVADNAMGELMAYLDSILLDEYLAEQLTWVAAGEPTYRDNIEGDTPTAADFLKARGKMLRARGSFAGNFLWILDPLAEAVVMGLTGWKTVDSNSSYGPAVVGTLFGIPVITNQTIRTGKRHPIATASHASNVLTITFTENPGLSVGQKISTEGLSTIYNLASASVVTVSSDGLTVTAALTATNGGTVSGGDDDVLIEETTHNLLVDRSRVWKATKTVPFVRFLGDLGTAGDVMQTITLLGFVGQAGRVRSICSKREDI